MNLGETLWLFGGRQADDLDDFLGDIWSSSNGGVWTLSTSTAPWGRRGAFATAVFDKEPLSAFLFGGEGQLSFTEVTYYNDVWREWDPA